MGANGNGLPMTTADNDPTRCSASREAAKRRHPHIAWGVSPRTMANKKYESREAATPDRMPMAAPYAAAEICRP